MCGVCVHTTSASLAYASSVAGTRKPKSATKVKLGASSSIEGIRYNTLQVSWVLAGNNARATNCPGSQDGRWIGGHVVGGRRSTASRFDLLVTVKH